MISALGSALPRSDECNRDKCFELSQTASEVGREATGRPDEGEEARRVHLVESESGERLQLLRVGWAPATTSATRCSGPSAGALETSCTKLRMSFLVESSLDNVR